MARRWSLVALAFAVAAVVLSIPALANGIGFLLAIAAAVIATYVRLGLPPFSRSRATLALALAGLAVAIHLFIYTAGLLV